MSAGTAPQMLQLCGYSHHRREAVGAPVGRALETVKKVVTTLGGNGSDRLPGIGGTLRHAFGLSDAPGKLAPLLSGSA